MTSIRVSLLVLASCLFASSAAFAQDPATPPTGAAAPAPPTAASSIPATTATAPAEAPTKAEDGGTRFRWGISGYGGPLMGGLSGGAGGIDLRFGAQITRMFGVYAQPVLLVGAGADASVKGASASAMALYGAGALGEINLADLVYLGLGPELLFGGMGSSSVSTTSASAAASTGPYLSLTGRAGFAFGSMQPNRRKAFTIGPDVRMVFNPGDPVIVPGIALGYDAF